MSSKLIRSTRRSNWSGIIGVVVLAVLSTLASLIMGTSSASAAGTTHDWSGVAQCESTGNWAINTGNGYYGGLQFSASTWNAYKPAGAPSRADLATIGQQTAAAEKVLSAQGIGAWPHCGKFLRDGVTPGVSATPVVQPAVSAPAPVPAPAPAAAPQASGNYTVAQGDTLQKLAARCGTTWQAVWDDNKATVSDPHWIYVGQKLVLNCSTSVQTASAASPAPAPASSDAQAAVSYATSKVGMAYGWAGTGPSSFDCSGLTMMAWKQAGVNLPHSSSLQSTVGTPVSRDQLQPGDLVFYYSPISHVAIYVGNGQVVSAENYGRGVTIRSLTGYFGNPTAMRRP